MNVISVPSTKVWLVIETAGSSFLCYCKGERLRFPCTITAIIEYMYTCIKWTCGRAGHCTSAKAKLSSLYSAGYALC